MLRMPEALNAMPASGSGTHNKQGANPMCPLAFLRTLPPGHLVSGFPAKDHSP